MTIKSIDLKTATLNDLVDQVHQGVEVILLEGGEPIARLIPNLLPSGQRTPDLHPDSIWISDDFDNELPDEFWLGDDAA